MNTDLGRQVQSEYHQLGWLSESPLFVPPPVSSREFGFDFLQHPRGSPPASGRSKGDPESGVINLCPSYSSRRSGFGLGNTCGRS
jgi:hypothetical protein